MRKKSRCAVLQRPLASAAEAQYMSVSNLASTSEDGRKILKLQNIV